jgi:dihydroorotate dehydrogenase (NAD+) catalytic subunit
MAIADTGIYDIHKTWMENLENGPDFKGKIPQRNIPDKTQWIDFLGHKVSSRLGIPAGPLLNSTWIGFAADFGYDIVTYKTIRTHDHPSHPAPNMVPVSIKGQLIPGKLPQSLQALSKLPNDITELGITNSFGNPSRSSKYLRQDIPLANSKLRDGQVMVVSIFGTEQGKVTMVDDFAGCAAFAKECGAKVIEANYSCPNVSSKEGSLYASPEAVYEFSSKIVKVLGDTPLIIKVGVFPNKSMMQETFVAAARAGVRAISGINTISMKVLDSKGNAALGSNRLNCGICGSPIHQAAVEFTQAARSIIDKQKLGMTLISTGGVMIPEHFQNFFNAGADFAMTATGMMWNPHLANQYKSTTLDKIYAT